MSKTRFCFTVNNYTEAGYVALQQVFVNTCKYAVIGKEVGEQGTPHLQGFVILKRSQRTKWLLTKIESATGKHPYLVFANGTNQEAADYCKKDGIFWEHGCYPKGKGSRTDIKDFLEAVQRGADDSVLAQEHPDCYAKYQRAKDSLRRHTKKKRKFEELSKQYKDAHLRTWQRVVLKKLMSQSDRTVTWVYDPDGNIGKSWLANYLLVQHGAFVIEGGKRADIAYAYDYEKIVVFDFTRSQEEQVNYSTIESFKNGRIFSSKYESGLKLFDPCQVLCLSNFNPDRTKLSADRWQVLSFPDIKKDPYEPPRKKPRLMRSPLFIPPCECGPNCNCGCACHK